MNDFLDRTPVAVTADSFTGFRCDAKLGFAGELVQCVERIAGRTDSREKLRSLTLRAESLGWQCVFVDGAAMHYCPAHTDPDRPRKRVLR